MLIELPISKLTVGMYVIDITYPKDKFRLSSEGWLEHQAIIDALKKKGVERVLVDTSKTKAAETIAPAETTQASSPKNNANRKTFLAQDIVKAKAVFNESKRIQRKVFDDAKNGVPLDLKPVSHITDESIELIFSNPDALACVLNIRKKDEYLLEHSVAVAALMTIFACYLKIDKETIRHLAVGAFLHDVGKIMIPEHILNKPGKLTDSEFVIMKTHANHSITTIENTPGIHQLSLEVARLHHEKLNGLGYPFNVSGEYISKYGRMIAICDIFDALTANRCYKQGYPQVKAFSILRALADNNELDSQLVNQFIKCLGVYPVGALVQLESKRLAIVETRNPDDPIRPRVKPFYHLEPKHFEKGSDIDLASVTDDLIVKCVRADDFDLDMEQIIDFLAHEG